MTAEELRTAFYKKGRCLGINRAYPGSYKPHWFWIIPHECVAGCVARKCGWNSYNEDNVWAQIDREPEKWVIGKEIDGKFQPLNEV